MNAFSHSRHFKVEVSLLEIKKGYIFGVEKIRKTLNCLIENVYYVSGLMYSLNSVSQICDKGNKDKFLSDCCTVMSIKSGEVILIAKRCKNVYFVDFSLFTGDDLKRYSDQSENVDL